MRAGVFVVAVAITTYAVLRLLGASGLGVTDAVVLLTCIAGLVVLGAVLPDRRARWIALAVVTALPLVADAAGAFDTRDTAADRGPDEPGSLPSAYALPVVWAATALLWLGAAAAGVRAGRQRGGR